jgi:NADH-quinone oxidoreductase subunit C
MPASPETVTALKERFCEIVASEFRGQTRIVAARESLFDVLESLKEDCGFDLLVDITCVDYLNYRDALERFGLVYLLANTISNERITVRCFLDESELSVPSATPLWDGADWLEREVWDMFGVRFEGHSNLMRILLPEEFTAFPLRKDYPMQGRGERHNFPVLRRGEA